MLCYGKPVVNYQEMKNAPAGKDATHALETMVETRAHVATRVRANPNVSVDGGLPCGNDHTQGSHGRHQHRAHDGAGPSLL